MLHKIEQHLLLPTPVSQISHTLYNQKEISVSIKRDELIHQDICGNKWRKLKYNLKEAIKKNSPGIITYGGMFSNHLVAVAAAGYYAGLATRGIVRSYNPDLDNPTIQKLLSLGMQLEYVSPIDYKEKEESKIINEIIRRHKDFFVIPEGGTNELSLNGVTESITEIKDYNFSHILVGLGTGGTMAGVLRATRDYKTKVIAVSPFKGAITDIEGFSLISDNDHKRLEVVPSCLDVRFGGYHSEIIDYIEDFKSTHDITLDPIYTVKVMMTLDDLVAKDYVPKGSNVLVLHTGGLQGVEGYYYQYRKKLKTQ